MKPDPRCIMDSLLTYRSSYWLNWSRVLYNDPAGSMVHMSITAINPTTDSSWIDVGQIRIIRSRGFARMEHAELPQKELDRMVEYLGAELVDFMLYHDIFNMIDWDKHAQLDNGGVNLRDCLKDNLRFCLESKVASS